mmetsp:Transcript_22129/g.39746  ORF Transcript_22129/g.39746 Transcript_22129/m.39746 type:complete len:643 (-) Transcript_22129:33-1961(-)|eukprot:CAMPEP_0197649238 /NCGR_PEP_ID=MMETSP1338-20131121/28232_1 /TAXON_ID=43686 ORGANISM="Pelagodinium beii, Strain RCC1491" /NCGR_SAMPLE_ID=MMETSP1338 /ASSEMBLY_ACC=CAM_ASM_000754 /LENGTH=642 /DNA_ID=CAMNT_0043223377 /DNA_START=44 /DNA_END=1972 /DNA_ORIENTATION=+
MASESILPEGKSDTPIASPVGIAAAATPSGRHRQQVKNTGHGEEDNHSSSSRAPRPRRSVGSLDWPLSKDEKRTCALKLYERDVRAADALLEEKEDEVGTLKKEIQVLRRLSSTSTACASESSPSADVEEENQESTPCGKVDEAEEAETVETSDQTEEMPTPEGAQAGPDAAEYAAEGTEKAWEASLLKALVRYFNERRLKRNQQEATEATPELRKLAKLHGGSETSVTDLWSSIGVKHELQPLDTVSWLAKSLPAAAVSTCEVGDRPKLWRQALLLPGLGPGGAEETPEARRNAYLLICEAAQESDEALRVEAESEVRAAWRGEAFMASAGVAEAVVSICVAASSQRERHVRGSAEVATLLLFALLSKQCSMADAEADAFWCLSQLLTEVKGGLADDCHSGGGAGGTAAAATTASRARKGQVLLRSYDPALAELLAVHGLAAMPAHRLGAAFCTRAGFSLESCAQLWDFLLADPQRFGFCDFAVVSLLLLRRKEMLELQGDAAGMAEVLLAAPKTASTEALLRTALAVRGLERLRRRKMASGKMAMSQTKGDRASAEMRPHSQPPARPEGPGVIKAIGSNLGSILGRVKGKTVDALEAGRTAARCAWPQAQQPAGALQSQAPAEEELQPLQTRQGHHSKEQ